MCSLSGCVACFLKLPWLRCEFPCCPNGLPKQLFDLVRKPAEIIILIMIYSIAFNAKWSLKIKSTILGLKSPVRSSFGSHGRLPEAQSGRCWRVRDHHITFSDIKLFKCLNAGPGWSRRSSVAVRVAVRRPFVFRLLYQIVIGRSTASPAPAAFIACLASPVIVGLNNIFI